jgi:hypothetical protein
MTIFTKGRQSVLVRVYGAGIFIGAERRNRITRIASVCFEIVYFASQADLDDYQRRYDSLADRYI